MFDSVSSVEAFRGTCNAFFAREDRLRAGDSSPKDSFPDVNPIILELYKDVLAQLETASQKRRVDFLNVLFEVSQQKLAQALPKGWDAASRASGEDYLNGRLAIWRRFMALRLGIDEESGRFSVESLWTKQGASGFTAKEKVRRYGNCVYELFQSIQEDGDKERLLGLVSGKKRDFEGNIDVLMNLLKMTDVSKNQGASLTEGGKGGGVFNKIHDLFLAFFKYFFAAYGSHVQGTSPQGHKRYCDMISNVLSKFDQLPEDARDANRWLPVELRALYKEARSASVDVFTEFGKKNVLGFGPWSKGCGALKDRLSEDLTDVRLLNELDARAFCAQHTGSMDAAAYIELYERCRDRLRVWGSQALALRFKLEADIRPSEYIPNILHNRLDYYSERLTDIDAAFTELNAMLKNTQSDWFSMLSDWAPQDKVIHASFKTLSDLSEQYTARLLWVNGTAYAYQETEGRLAYEMTACAEYRDKFSGGYDLTNTVTFSDFLVSQFSQYCKALKRACLKVHSDKAHDLPAEISTYCTNALTELSEELDAMAADWLVSYWGDATLEEKGHTAPRECAPLIIRRPNPSLLVLDALKDYQAWIGKSVADDLKKKTTIYLGRNFFEGPEEHRAQYEWLRKSHARIVECEREAFESSKEAKKELATTEAKLATTEAEKAAAEAEKAAAEAGRAAAEAEKAAAEAEKAAAEAGRAAAEAEKAAAEAEKAAAEEGRAAAEAEKAAAEKGIIEFIERHLEKKWGFYCTLGDDDIAARCTEKFGGNGAVTPARIVSALTLVRMGFFAKEGSGPQRHNTSGSEARVTPCSTAFHQ